MERPRTQYAWNGDVALAYQVFGEGPLDLVYMEGWAGNIDVAWESPYLSSFLRGLGNVGRVVFMDRRGRGLSERFSPDAVSPFEILADAILVVLSAAEADRAVVMATTEAAPLALILAATHPDRIVALVLCDPTVSYSANEDFPETRLRLAGRHSSTGFVPRRHARPGGTGRRTTRSATGFSAGAGRRKLPAR